ncbi:MAG TPA: chemotaxis protein CheW [Cyanobacteria bacterium UBA8543]|nr:chemotaxis protein CheW [Cyanobacteria bacterium UBA8543]
MKNFPLNLQAGDTRLPNARQVTPSLKLIVFGIGSLNLALPIESVYKVVNHTPVYGSGLNAVGVAHVGDGEVTVVDLYQQFFKASSFKESTQIAYLVIVKNTLGELYGIPITDTPILLEVPLSQIRVLPESYRQADTLGVASHVAVIPQEASPLTIFLLDVDLLLPFFQQLTATQG